jgi:hypothetical protein
VRNINTYFAEDNKYHSLAVSGKTAANDDFCSKQQTPAESMEKKLVKNGDGGT